MIGLVISKEEKYRFSERNLVDTVFLNVNSFIRCPPNMGEDSKRSSGSCYQKLRRVSKVDETVRYK